MILVRDLRFDNLLAIFWPVSVNLRWTSGLNASSWLRLEEQVQYN